jgi:hypothetical protein
VLTRDGDAERGQEFLRWILSENKPSVEVYGADRNTVNLSLLLGDRNAALRSLDEFSDRKFDSEFNAILMERDVAFDPIRDEPAFIAIMDDYERNAAEQRELLQAMNAN